MSLWVNPDPVIPPLQDWWQPLSVLWDDTEDPAQVLTHYYCCLVETVIPLTLADQLTARQWTYAREMLDRGPEPQGLIEWQSRWRNFLEYVWKMVLDHQGRIAKAERAAARRRKPAPPPPPPPVLEL